MAISWRCPLSLHAYAAAGRKGAGPASDLPELRAADDLRGLLPPAGAPSRRRASRAGATGPVCSTCKSGHALLPDFIVHGRHDSVQAIGAALAAELLGDGPRRLWEAVPARTVRSWQQRFAEGADLLTASLGAVAVALVAGAPGAAAGSRADGHCAGRGGGDVVGGLTALAGQAGCPRRCRWPTSWSAASC